MITQNIELENQKRASFQARAREHHGKLDLKALLIKPVQRFPQFELMMKVCFFSNFCCHKISFNHTKVCKDLCVAKCIIHSYIN